MESDLSSRRTMLAKVRLFLWVLVPIVAALGIGAIYLRKEHAAHVLPDFTHRYGGSFSLTASDGSQVTDKTLAGKPYAIFFGFTRCPDVCPTSLSRMAALRKKLGADGNRFNIVFVSVDPEHDKPADIGNYVALFDTPIMGLTGTAAELAKIKKGFGVFSQKVPVDGGDYTIDHTATIYLMTAKGDLAGTIDYHEGEATALAKLQQLVD